MLICWRQSDSLQLKVVILCFWIGGLDGGAGYTVKSLLSQVWALHMWLNVVSALFCDPFTSRFLTCTPDNGGSSLWDLFDLVQLETFKKKALTAGGTTESMLSSSTLTFSQCLMIQKDRHFQRGDWGDLTSLMSQRLDGQINTWHSHCRSLYQLVCFSLPSEKYKCKPQLHLVARKS